MSKPLITGILLACAILSAIFPTGSFAVAQQPHELVNDVIQRVLSRIEANSDTISAEPAELARFFEQELSPHLAFNTITRWVIGKQTWSGMAEADREELLNAIRSHVVGIYASLLARGQEVTIEVDSSSDVAQHSARVNAVLSTSDGRDFALQFRLLLRQDQWKLFDLTVDGLSFARSLKAELNPVIAASGVNGLKQYLVERAKK